MQKRKVLIPLCVVFIFSILVTLIAINRDSAPTEDTVSASASEKTEIRVFKDIRYGPEAVQTLDLNLPVGGTKDRGLVIFLHGGGWIGGDKSSVEKSYPVFKSNKYFATASINYSLVNDGKSDIHDIIDDITLAMEQIKTLASSYSVNLNKVVLGGHSAGGHLSLLYAYKYADISPIELVGVFASAPVADLSIEAFYTDNTYGDEKKMCTIISQLCGKDFDSKTRKSVKDILDEHSAINYVSDSTVPTIILHGSNDTIAPIFGSLMLTEELTKHAVNHELVLFENAGHSMKNCEETRKYASELMLACVKEWFDITTE
ncbi:MAG: alpha/beta hydrolase [Clostridia bacterium]|nr:alpha/beta hydrolase [Clostridia bacterium]